MIVTITMNIKYDNLDYKIESLLDELTYDLPALVKKGSRILYNDGGSIEAEITIKKSSKGAGND